MDREVTSANEIVPTKEIYENNLQAKLNIVIIDDSFFPIIDGVAYVVNIYAKILTQMGHNVTVFAPNTGKFDDSTLPYKVIRCKSINMKAWGYRVAMPLFHREFRKKVKNEKIDIIHIHSPFSLGKEGIRIARKRKIPILATLHTQFKQDFYHFTKSKFLTYLAMKIIMKNFNAVDEVFILNSFSEKVFREYGYKGEVRIMRNATDMVPLEEDKKAALMESVKKEYDIKAKYVFIFVGRIVEQKNIFFLCDALKLMQEANLDFQMIFVGDGLEKKKLCEYVIKEGISERVIFTGMVRDREKLSALFCLSSLQLFPSVYDTSALVTLEAAAHKLPTVLIKGSVTSSDIVEGFNGYLLEEDVEKFAKGVMSILSHEAELIEMREKCFKNLYCTWETALENVCKVYNEHICNNKKRIAIKENQKGKNKKASQCEKIPE